MKRNIIAIAIILTIFGCNNANKNNESVAPSQEMVIPDAATADSTATEKIIKTADMRFRVKDVQSTKEKLSQTIKNQGGTVAEFSIESIIQETQKVKQSLDSVKEITAYRTEGYLVAKVPSEKLDDFTNATAKMAVFVDNQSMKMDDQSLTYLSNKSKAGNRLDAVDQMGKLAGKKSSNVETALNIKDDLVDKKIQNLSIDSKVKYSTIKLNFYQDNTIKTAIVANDNVNDYKPDFGNRFWLAIVNGWIIFREIILALSNLWLLIVVGIGVYFIVRHFIRKNKIALDLATKNLMDSRK